MKTLKVCSAFLSALFFAGVLHAQAPPGWTPPDPISSFSFLDVSNWTDDLGYFPISFTNLNPAFPGISGDGSGLSVNTNLPSWLQFNVMESSNAVTNLTVDVGSLTIWVSPVWTSTSTNGPGGPGMAGRLIDVGSYTTNASIGWWSLYFSSDGTNLNFCTQTNSGDGTTVTNLTAPISWSSNQWHFVALIYSSSNSALYVDGAPVVTNGLGVTILPGPDVLSNGFCIGSDTNGVLQCQAGLSELYTYDFPLDADTVSNLYNYYFPGYIVIDPFFQTYATIASGQSSPAPPPVFNAVTGSGVLTNGISATNCISSAKVWITNVVCKLSNSGTNPVANFTFTIEGGSNGVPYDVFANSVLDFTTNTSWAWLGQGYQCMTYTVSNLPPKTTFMILGTPQDSGGAGLTDAYMILKLHDNPLVPDSSGDNMLDGWKVFWGLNPNVNNPAQAGLRMTYTYDTGGWLQQVAGQKSGSVTPDSEGNIQTVSQ